MCVCVCVCRGRGGLKRSAGWRYSRTWCQYCRLDITLMGGQFHETTHITQLQLSRTGVVWRTHFADPRNSAELFVETITGMN